MKSNTGKIVFRKYCGVLNIGKNKFGAGGPAFLPRFLNSNLAQSNSARGLLNSPPKCSIYFPRSQIYTTILIWRN